MKTMFNRLLCLLLFLSIAHVAFAVSVDRIVLVQRQPDVYTGNPLMTLNTKTGQTLVVWTQHSGDRSVRSIRGQLLQPDGKLAGSSFVIIPSSLRPGSPSITYDPDTNQFVLVYDSSKQKDTSEIFAIRLKPTGRKLGKAVLISVPSKPADLLFNIRPVILYDSVNKANVILWTKFNEAAPNPNDPPGIFGAVLNSNLSIRKKAVFVENIESGPGTLFGPHFGDAAIHPSGKILLTQVLFTPITFDSEFSIAQLDPTLQNPVSTITNLNDAPGNSGCQFGICFDIKLMRSQGGQMATLYSQEDGIHKRKISPQGNPLDKETKFLPEPLREVPVKINGSAFSVSTTSKEIAVLGFIPSEIEEAQFWLQRANAKGKALGAPIEIESGVDSVRGGTILALPASSADHTYAVLYLEGERDNPPLSNTGVGLVLLRVNTSH